MPVQERGRDDSRRSGEIEHWGDSRPLLHRRPPSEATEWSPSDRISEEKGSTRVFAGKKDGSAPTDEHDEEEIRMLAMATRKDDDLDEENAEIVAFERNLFATVDRTIEISARWSRILISKFSDMREQFADSQREREERKQRLDRGEYDKVSIFIDQNGSATGNDNANVNDNGESVPNANDSGVQHEEMGSTDMPDAEEAADDEDLEIGTSIDDEKASNKDVVVDNGDANGIANSENNGKANANVNIGSATIANENDMQHKEMSSIGMQDAVEAADDEGLQIGSNIDDERVFERMSDEDDTL